MVDRAAAGHHLCLATRYPAAGDQFRRCITILLDGCGVHSAALFGTTTGLLFDEHVERVRALGSHCLGPDSPIVARSGRDRGGCHRSDPCGRSAVRGAWSALDDMPVSAWVALRPMLVITAVSFVFFSIVALYFIFKQRGKLAAIALAASMIPAGLSMVIAVAKTAPYFSLADVARYLNPRLEKGGHAMFEGPLDDSSSLIFYLNRKFFFVNQNSRKEAPMGAPATDIFLNEQAVLDKWGQPDAVYLIVEQSRADYWKQLVISRFHVYHQVTTSGTYVVLSNQL